MPQAEAKQQSQIEKKQSAEGKGVLPQAAKEKTSFDFLAEEVIKSHPSMNQSQKSALLSLTESIEKKAEEIRATAKLRGESYDSYEFRRAGYLFEVASYFLTNESFEPRWLTDGTLDGFSEFVPQVGDWRRSQVFDAFSRDLFLRFQNGSGAENKLIIKNYDNFAASYQELRSIARGDSSLVAHQLLAYTVADSRFDYNLLGTEKRGEFVKAISEIAQAIGNYKKATKVSPAVNRLGSENFYQAYRETKGDIAGAKQVVLEKIAEESRGFSEFLKLKIGNPKEDYKMPQEFKLKGPAVVWQGEAGFITPGGITDAIYTSGAGNCACVVRKDLDVHGKVLRVGLAHVGPGMGESAIRSYLSDPLRGAESSELYIIGGESENAYKIQKLVSEQKLELKYLHHEYNLRTEDVTSLCVMRDGKIYVGSIEGLDDDQKTSQISDSRAKNNTFGLEIRRFK